MDLYKDARDFPATLRGRCRPVTSVQFARAGFSVARIRTRTRRGSLVRAHRGSYLVRLGPPDLLDRIRAALPACPPGAVIGYHTAAALHGFGIPEDADVHVVVPVGGPVPHRRGMRAHESVQEIVPFRRLGVACTSPARTAVDLARILDRPMALAVLDAALYARACTAEELAEEVPRQGRLRGVRQARELVALADGRAACRQESHLRLILHDGGLRHFEPQVEVWDPDRWWSRFPRCRLDLADRAHRLAVEYDGVSHARGRLREDRKRHNWLDERGWTMRYFTDHDLYRAPHEIVPILRRALADLRRHRPSGAVDRREAAIH